MLKSFISRKKEDDYIFETSDLLIVFDDENKTSDINRVTSISDGAVIVAGMHKVPLLDCEITTGKEGRNFFYRAPSRSVIETERLAKLEFNTVLEQVTAYSKPIPPTQMDAMKWVLLVIIIFFFIIFGITACKG